VLTGSTSGLNPTYPPDPSVKRGLIKTERTFTHEDLATLLAKIEKKRLAPAA